MCETWQYICKTNAHDLTCLKRMFGLVMCMFSSVGFLKNQKGFLSSSAQNSQIMKLTPFGLSFCFTSKSVIFNLILY